MSCGSACRNGKYEIIGLSIHGFSPLRKERARDGAPAVTGAWPALSNSRRVGSISSAFSHPPGLTKQFEVSAKALFFLASSNPTGNIMTVLIGLPDPSRCVFTEREPDASLAKSSCTQTLDL